MYNTLTAIHMFDMNLNKPSKFSTDMTKLTYFFSNFVYSISNIVEQKQTVYSVYSLFY